MDLCWGPRLSTFSYCGIKAEQRSKVLGVSTQSGSCYPQGALRVMPEKGGGPRDTGVTLATVESQSMLPAVLGTCASCQFSKDLMTKVLRAEVTPDIAYEVQGI